MLALPLAVLSVVSYYSIVLPEGLDFLPLVYLPLLTSQ